jgi:hypothetical protein
MIKLNSKGQGAMEYLTTYGWAILVVLVVGMVLYQLGVFNQQGTVIITGFPQLKPVLQAITYNGAAGTFEASFINARGTALQLTAINMSDLITNSPCTITSLQNTSVPAGAILKVTGTCGEKPSKEAYDINLSVSYNVAIENIFSHVESGTIQGQTE